MVSGESDAKSESDADSDKNVDSKSEADSDKNDDSESDFSESSNDDDKLEDLYNFWQLEMCKQMKKWSGVK